MLPLGTPKTIGKDIRFTGPEFGVLDLKIVVPNVKVGVLDLEFNLHDLKSGVLDL